MGLFHSFTDQNGQLRAFTDQIGLNVCGQSSCSNLNFGQSAFRRAFESYRKKFRKQSAREDHKGAKMSSDELIDVDDSKPAVSPPTARTPMTARMLVSMPVVVNRSQKKRKRHHRTVPLREKQVGSM